jgi:hypothetical protein
LAEYERDMYGGKRYMVTGGVTGNREVTVADESGFIGGAHCPF